MYSVRPENISEHCFQVAVIAQHLVSIKTMRLGEISTRMRLSRPLFTMKSQRQNFGYPYAC